MIAASNPAAEPATTAVTSAIIAEMVRNICDRPPQFLATAAVPLAGR